LKYKWVLFDADNTLFDFHASSEIAFHQSFKHHGIESDDNIYNSFREINLRTWKAYDENKLSHEEIKRVRFQSLFDQHGIRGIDPLDFNSLYFERLVHNARYVEWALELLDLLDGKVRLAIITNGMKEVQRPRLLYCGLMDRFDLVVISGEIGLSKPNRSFFQYVFERMDFPDKKEVLVVGDNIFADIKGGNDFGFDTAWFNPHLTANQNGIEADFEIASLKELKTIIV